MRIEIENVIEKWKIFHSCQLTMEKVGKKKKKYRTIVQFNQSLAATCCRSFVKLLFSFSLFIEEKKQTKKRKQIFSEMKIEYNSFENWSAIGFIDMNEGYIVRENLIKNGFKCFTCLFSSIMFHLLSFFVVVVDVALLQFC